MSRRLRRASRVGSGPAYRARQGDRPNPDGLSVLGRRHSVPSHGPRPLVLRQLAWDAIAFHAMLGDTVRFESFCHHCAVPIHIELHDGVATVVDPPESIVYFALPPTKWWDDIIATCGSTMVFFASPEHRDASDLCAKADLSASLTPDQVHVLSGPSYATKFALEYEMPSKEVLLAHWAEMGLTGDYWTL